MKWFNSLSVVSVMALTLTACGGGGDGGGTQPVAAPSTGVFIDSPVQGLSYSSAPSGLSGLTGPNGEFLYRAGDRVTFSIGGYVLVGMDASPVLGQTQVTPFIFLGNTSVPSVTHVGPVNLARLLLALDTVPGGETIAPFQQRHLYCQCLRILGLRFLTPRWQTWGFDRLGGRCHRTPSEAVAIWELVYRRHMNELQVITFLPDGTFICTMTALVAGSVDGMERGTYQWNATTNELTYTVAVNTDGTGALSHPSASQTPPYTFVIDPTGNTAVFHFGPNVSNQIVFTRVIDANNLLVGAWKVPVFESGLFPVLTFLPDGTFTVATDQADSDPAGMERGTYVYDATTGNVTFTTTVDTNGENGVNDSPTLPAKVDVQMIVTEALGQFDFLQVQFEPNSFIHFDRVRVP
jgi:hypothetical protein